MRYIKEYENLYKIDINGDVYREESIVYSDKRYPNGRRLKGGKLKSILGTNGYLSITLTKNGRKKRFYIHRLIGELYIDNPYNKPCINHIDGNKLNNDISNLEWVTYLENNIHSIEKLDKIKRGYNVNNELEIDILSLYNFGYRQYEIAEQLGCSRPTVNWHINKRFTNKF